mgnify:CR=1 FL=1
MIPEFPKFKKLEFSDRTDVEKMTHQFQPYSDFNFTSMWSWNVLGQMQLSKLKGNLIVKFNDYVTGEPFYSFIGLDDVSNTAQQLLNLSIKEGLDPVLKLLTEETVKKIDHDDFIITTDEDSYDYILSVDHLVKYEGSKFTSKRNYIRRFKNAYSSETRLVDLKDPNIKKKITDLFNLWRLHKSLGDSYAEHEVISLSRFLQMDDYSKFISVGLFIDEALIAFWILEQLDDDKCLSHYEKANVLEYVGVYPYLANETAKILSKMGVKYINFEQDLGIPGLRESKKSYSPSTYLKQYILTYRNA